MNINFASVDAEFIKGKVKAGYYCNATELVRDAVRKLRESDQENEDKHDRLIAALEEGEASIREHGTIPYTPELLERITKEALEDFANGVKPDPDVCP